MSRPTLLALAALLCTAASPIRAADPLLAIPGKVIYENSLAEKPGAPWNAPKGKWEAVEGVLRGAELAEDKHGAVLRLMGPVADNVVVEYQFRLLEGAKSTTLSINGVKDHLCRLVFAPTAFVVQK
ncbi:MAG TPA: hypothetical protein VD994_02025, partial [Prosthecobacter sp.]|nr:hypothetical protein [Prosthecobacter sp.]